MHVLAVLLLADWRTSFETGENLLKQGRLAEARRAFQAARKEAPDNPVVWDALGRTEFSAGRFRQAQSWFEQELAASGGQHPSVLGNLARTHIAVGDIRAALATIEKALYMAPDSAPLWHLRGQAFFVIGDHRQAKSAIAKAIALGAGAAALNDMALIDHNPGTLEDAIRQLPIGQARSRIIANLGVLRFRSGDKAGAAHWLKRALDEMEASVGPNHPDVARILDDYSAVLEKSGRKSEARELARRAALVSSSTIDWRDLGK